MQTELERLRQVVGDGDAEVLERWLDAAAGHCWQLAPPRLFGELKDRAQPVLVALARGLASADTLEVGGPELREAFQHFSFLSGWMAGAELSISATVALCLGLRDLAGGDIGPLDEALVTTVVEAFAVGLRQSAKAHHRQVVEKSQVVVMLPGATSVLFLVADPDRHALDDAVGRLMMVSFTRDAANVVLDGSALLDQRAVLPTAWELLCEHREALAGRHVLLTGVAKDVAAALRPLAGLAGECCEALEEGLRAAGVELAARGETDG